MGYNKKNNLLIAKRVQDAYLKHQKEGVTTRSIYKNYIYPEFLISIATMYNYLGKNVRKDLKEFGEINIEMKNLEIKSSALSPELLSEIGELVKREIATGNQQLIASIGTMIGFV